MKEQINTLRTCSVTANPPGKQTQMYKYLDKVIYD